jgi:hydrogenase maturation protein HypF
MGRRFGLRGSVQGVGFRPWVRRTAHELGVRGSVANAPGGVRIDGFGEADALDAFLARMAAPALPGARVEDIGTRALFADPEPEGFEIVSSRTRADPRGREIALAPDLPSCSACLSELLTPSARRFRYPFVSCAQCGPRYTIARNLPWDRVRTAMDEFPLCLDCAAEYRDSDDRRFHAEATSCPDCGPSLCCIDAGREVAAGNEASLARAVAALRRRQIVAVQGIGGFHLACDASDESAVRRLRERKRRPRRPLAVMLCSVGEVEKHALVSADERRLLESDPRPIVLLRRRPDSSLAPSLAPGSPMLGVLLGYTPLHRLLLDDFGGPLVMTSANRSGEPIAHRLDAAVSTLVGVADLVLANDREIVAPCDDSVVLSAASGPIVLRRSRGYVPRPLRLARPAPRAVLAFGGHWGNTICVAAGEHAWPSAHVGDIESPDSVARLEETVQRWLAWLDVDPAIVAHDLHPGYESTRLARSWPGARAIGVQHHHAHMAAVLGEHGVDGPALSLTWDGTGAGLDGAAWGGELLVGDARSVRRLATFRPISLAGGEQAIREPWRLALALLEDAFEADVPDEAIERSRFVSEERIAGVKALLARPELCAPAHGVGRYFDAVGALLLERPVATYSGELAQALNFLATGRPAHPYPFELDTRRSPWQVDLRPAVRALVDDLLSRQPSAEVADRFHATLVAAGDAAVREGLRVLGAETCGAGRGRSARVALAGGCFQNRILLDGLAARLGRDLEVLRPVHLPPGDGGLAFGQAVVADALASAEGTPAQAAPEEGDG